jgi:Contractile injection system tube protein
MAKLSGPELVGNTLSEDQYIAIEFDFNPKAIELKHGTKRPEKKSGQSDAEVSSLDRLGIAQLNLKETTFYGEHTLLYCEHLNAWSFAEEQEKGKTPQLPILQFTWGDFELQGEQLIEVTLASVTINYDRFTSSGLPIRATATIMLAQELPSVGTQNPTSGGLPNRRGHVLTSGETLPGIALAKYGNPAKWRMLAEENQLDDPLRVQPGSVLYVPSRAELADRGAG